MYSGLRPSRAIMRRVAHVQSALGLSGHMATARSGGKPPGGSLSAGGAQSAREDYACMHARIEADMQSSWPVVMGGRPPSLAQYLSGMAAVPALRSTTKVSRLAQTPVIQSPLKVLNRH